MAQDVRIRPPFNGGVRGGGRVASIFVTPYTSTATHPTAGLDEVDLDRPRPDFFRTTNDYCDVILKAKKMSNADSSSNRLAPTKTLAPLRDLLYGLPSTKSVMKFAKNHAIEHETAMVHMSHRSSANVQSKNGTPAASRHSVTQIGKTPSSYPVADCSPVVVTSQPSARSAAYSSASSASSLLCPRCGKCRCDDCATSSAPDRSSPSAWLCGSAVLCSPRRLVDCLSCFCCVKACAYHMTGSDKVVVRRRCSRQPLKPTQEHSEFTIAAPTSIEPLEKIASAKSGGGSCGGEIRSINGETRGVDVSSLAAKNSSPSSCGCCARWTLLCLAPLALPCLCCYWPLRGVEWCAERAFYRCTAKGCRCPETVGHAFRNIENGLNDRRPQTRNLPPPH